MSIARDQITGLVLAGGRGSRMGGTDKGLQMLVGKPLAQHAIERLQPQVGPLLLNANRNAAEYAKLATTFGASTISDNLPDFAGPLAGFHSGLQHCQTPYLATVPCDSPFFPLNLVAVFSQVMPSHDFVVARTGQWPQPVFCLMRCEQVRSSLERFLQAGGRKIDRWYADLNFAYADFANERDFHNFNTLTELQQFNAP